MTVPLEKTIGHIFCLFAFSEFLYLCMCMYTLVFFVNFKSVIRLDKTLPTSADDKKTIETKPFVVNVLDEISNCVGELTEVKLAANSFFIHLERKSEKLLSLKATEKFDEKCFCRKEILENS